jgi:glycosyltransferase involved in cell wall biosynthesis
VTLVRVAVVSPPLDASGGMGRLMTYALAALRQDEEQIEVIDTRGHRPNPKTSIFPLLRGCWRILVLRALGRVDVVHVNIAAYGSTVRKAVVVLVCRLLGVPVVLHLHAGNYPEFFDPLPDRAKHWVRWTFSAAKTVVVLTETWRRYVCSELGVPDHRVVVLPNGAPGPSSVAPRRRAPEEPLRLLFLGRLTEEKGVPDLLAALASPLLQGRWEATLAGDGDTDAYRRRAQALGLGSRVSFPGWVEADETYRLLSGAHVLVLPSHVEALPMVIVEAFAWGVPVVATRVGGVPEILHDQVEGLLVPPGDLSRLTDALLRLVDDEPLRLRLGTCARAAWERSYAIEPYANHLAHEWRRVGLCRGEDRRPALHGTHG